MKKLALICVALYSTTAFFIWGEHYAPPEGIPQSLKGLFAAATTFSIFSFAPVIGILSSSREHFKEQPQKTSPTALLAAAIWLSAWVFLGCYLYYIAPLIAPVLVLVFVFIIILIL